MNTAKMKKTTRTVLGPMALGAVLALTCGRGNAQDAPASGATLSVQGDPSNDEQYLLQLLNRARQDPVGEGQRLEAWLNLPAQASLVSQFSIDPAQIAAAFAAIPATPPLAFNPDLLAAARGHSEDLAPLDGNSPDGNDHDGTDGSTPSSRVAAAGYPDVDFAGENYMPGAASDYQTHAAFLVDWGVPSLGHRITAMSINSPFGLNVVGIGVATIPPNVSATNPLVTTEDFGFPGMTYVGSTLTPADAPAILTGVVYHDANGNGQYDPGEGVAGVTVSMNGGAYYAVTSASGGYSFPLVNLADGSNADGTVAISVTGLPNGAANVGATVAVQHYTSTAGTYRGNVEFDYATVTGGGFALAPPMSAFFDGAAALSGGWNYLVFANSGIFGYYNTANYPYIFHADMGFEYVFDAGDGKSGVYLYDFKSGDFFYTSPTFGFPYLYDFALQSVLYYYPDPSNPGHYNTNGVRYFYDYATGQIITR